MAASSSHKSPLDASLKKRGGEKINPGISTIDISELNLARCKLWIWTVLERRLMTFHKSTITNNNAYWETTSRRLKKGTTTHLNTALSERRATRQTLQEMRSTSKGQTLDFRQANVSKKKKPCVNDPITNAVWFIGVLITNFICSRIWFGIKWVPQALKHYSQCPIISVSWLYLWFLYSLKRF